MAERERKEGRRERWGMREWKGGTSGGRESKYNWGRRRIEEDVDVYISLKRNATVEELNSFDDSSACIYHNNRIKDRAHFLFGGPRKGI